MVVTKEIKVIWTQSNCHELTIEEAVNQTNGILFIKTDYNKSFPVDDIVFKLIVPFIKYVYTSFNQNLRASLTQHFMTTQITDQVNEDKISNFAAPPEIFGKMAIQLSLLNHIKRIKCTSKHQNRKYCNLE